MIIRKYHIIMNRQEIARRLREVASNVSDRLIHAAHRSVSLVCLADAFAPQHSKQVCSAFGCQSIHYTFRNDYKGSFYVIELKYNRLAKSAKKQIEQREYAKAHLDSGKRVVMAIKFSSRNRNIESYEVEEEKK